MEIEPVAHHRDILELQRQAKAIFVEDAIYDYLHALVARTRDHPQIATGVSPRGALSFKTALQAAALVAGRDYVSPADIERYAVPCLAHRIRLRDHAAYEFDWQAAARVVETIRQSIPLPHHRD